MKADDPRLDPAIRNHFVYRYFDRNGVLLYVGCTKRPERRWREHQRDRAQMAKRVRTVRMQGPFNYMVAREIERVALRTERPVFATTPQDLSASFRREWWIERQVREHSTPGMSLDERMTLWRRFSRKANRIDWLGDAYARSAA